MNYYELLGVSKNANKEEIKSAYKKQMKKWHPDINKSEDAVNMSSKINEAKEVLLDDEKRRDYDEYLTKKTEENYNRYTQRRKNESNVSEDNNTYENEKVTKWNYLRSWLKYANLTPFRKMIGLLGVLLESFICWLIKIILIIIAFTCNLGSYMIRTIFVYLSPVIGILVFLFIVQCLSNGFKETIESNEGAFNAMIVLTVSFFASILLPIFSKMILSPKVFDILYNKIDINLFKKCVGYKE